MCPHNVSDLTSTEFNEFCRAKKRDETCRYYLNVHRKKNKEKVSSVVDEILAVPSHNERIQALCAENGFCPYEVCVKAGNRADVIICDYYHIFSPRIREAFLTKMGKNVEDSVVIVDEAHNLPERIRKLLSVNLSEYTLNQAAKEAKVMGYSNLYEDFDDTLMVLKKLGRGLKKDREKNAAREEFTEAVEEAVKQPLADFAAEACALGEEVLSIPKRHRSYAKSVARFLTSWAGEDLGYTRILRRGKRLTLSYHCLDPSISAGEVFAKARASALMSGTLTPAHMYSEILGLAENTEERVYESPFPKENRLVLLVSGVTTKFTKRTDYMYSKYGRVIANCLKRVPGNAAVFFPSYALLNRVYREVEDRGVGKKFVVEEQGSSKEEKRLLYNRLAKNTDGGAVLFGVSAGSLSEGVDYPGKILDAVFVAGLPLKKPDLLTQALIDYYEIRFGRGWDYGYIYPAMNRALQAAGRCIRSETDRGAIVLLDERFRWANYAKCFPPDYDFIVTETPGKYLKKFFGLN